MKQFIFLFLLTVLLGCTGNKRVNDNPLANDTDTVMVSKGYDEVKLFKIRTGHITATISVNGKPCVFLIDTGGGATLIDKSKRQKFGLKASINSEFRKNHARQVDGVLGTDFLDKYGAVIDYAQQRLYLRIREQD